MITLELSKAEVTLIWNLLTNAADKCRDDARRMLAPAAKLQATEDADACITLANKIAHHEVKHV